MKRVPLLAGSGMLILASFANAGSYQGEVFGEYGRIDTDSGDIRGIEVGGKYHLKPVVTDNKPLAEAAFITKSSWLGAALYDEELTIDAPGKDTKVDIDGVIFNGHYVMPHASKQHDQYLIGAEISTGDIDGVHLYGGLYLNRHIKYDSTLLLSFTHTDADGDTFNLNAIGAHFKMLRPYEGRVFNIEGSIEFIDQDGTTANFQAEVDYYFNPTTSLGGLFGIALGDADGFRTGIRAQHFVTEQLSFYGTATVANLDDEDVKTLDLGVNVRF